MSQVGCAPSMGSTGDSSVQAGAAITLERLYDEYGHRIYRYCFRLCGDVTDAEDLAQEVILAAHRDLPRFQGRSSLSTWLYSVAFHRWLRIKEQRRLPTVPISQEAGLASSAPDPAAQIDRMVLDEAIGRLSDPLREALILVKVEGLTSREAADVLQVPQGTVQWRVHEALKQLRACISSTEGAEQNSRFCPATQHGGKAV
jgi:RNA polymerase sigma-70 factor, ECF subfamily